jgi:hypothetical protein
MDKLSVLAEFEKIADREELENDEFKLFLLLLASYDSAKQYGEICRGSVAAALGKDFSSAGLDRACRRLSTLGLIEVIAPPPEGAAGGNSIMVYRITHDTTGQG